MKEKDGSEKQRGCLVCEVVFVQDGESQLGQPLDCSRKFTAPVSEQKSIA
jgi:hypothetical protein